MGDNVYSIDRGIAVIKPRQPFLDWIRNLPDPEHQITLEELRSDCVSILVPERESDQDGMKFIRANHSWIFEVMLHGWWTDEASWPVKRDWKTFLEWFDVEFHSEVIDLTSHPIHKEEY